jgi:hypothetical protein
MRYPEGIEIQHASKNSLSQRKRKPWPIPCLINNTPPLMAIVENIDISRISNACTCSLVNFLCRFIAVILEMAQRLSEYNNYADKHNYMGCKIYGRHFYWI